MPVILKRPRARIELGEIWEYIVDDSEGNADSVALAFKRDLEDLVWRESGQPVSLHQPIDPPIRCLPETPGCPASRIRPIPDAPRKSPGLW